MHGKVVLLVLSFVAVSLAFYINDDNPSLSDLVAEYGDQQRAFPKFEEPSEEEWLSIIQEILEDGNVPKYFDQKNYSSEANETGLFSDTNGVEGQWTATAYGRYTLVKDYLLRSFLRVDSRDVNGTKTVSATGAQTLFANLNTALQRFSVTEVRYGVTALVSNSSSNQSYELVGNTRGVSEGYIVHNLIDFAVYNIKSMELNNVSNVFSVSQMEYEGNMFQSPDAIIISGELTGSSAPFSPSAADSAFQLKDPDAFIRYLRDNKVSSPYLTMTKGYFNEVVYPGMEGHYNYSSDSSTQTFPGYAIVNNTVDFYGEYRVSNTTEGSDQSPLYHDLLTFIFANTM